MSCEEPKNLEKKKKLCPVCRTEIYQKGLYWCNKCKKWYEEIDFLDSIEFDNDCKKCEYLTETSFTKNNLPLFYCNSLTSKRIMEKIKDFRKCNEIKIKQP